jgi:putative pantetheine hydrolase
MTGGAESGGAPTPGPHNAITDVAGVEVGHRTLDRAPFLTGVTVILARGGAVAAVDVRGAAPATRETDALALENLVSEVHAVVLSGGSAYGLGCADGVMAFLEEQGVGHRVGTGQGEVVPIVPAAALFDLGRGGDFAARPDARAAYEAARAASGGRVEQGNAGAGTGALFAGRRLKGGIGTASAVTAAGTVGALVALNAVGSPLDPATGRLSGATFGLGEEFAGLGAPSAAELEASPLAQAVDDELAAAGGEAPRASTVLGVVAVDVALSKAEAQRLARVAHDGLARAIRPAHTLFDGDVIFALSTGARPLFDAAGAASAPGARSASAAFGAERGAALIGLFEQGAGCVARAVAHAVLAARSVGPFVAYRDAFPSALAGRDRGRAAGQ